MTTADEAARAPALLTAREENRALSDQWRMLRRFSTFVAVISAPAAFLWAWQHTGLSLGWAIFATAVAAFAFRGALDLVFRKFIPWPSLFATEDIGLREDDVVNRRRAWYWRQKYRLAAGIALFFVFIWFIEFSFGHHTSPWTVAGNTASAIGRVSKDPQDYTLFVQLPIFFLFNFLIFMGPMMLMGISQIRGFEPGDAKWGVKLDDVRGQAEAKERCAGSSTSGNRARRSSVRVAAASAA
jgi:cell division protease FtsH